MKLKTTTLLVAGTLLGATMLPAQANNDAMMNLLQVLRDRGTISPEDYNALKTAADTDKAASEEVVQKIDQVEQDAVKVDLKKGLKISTGDDAFEMKIGGRVMADYAWIDDDRDLDGNGSEFRRARLYVSGKVFNDWVYKLQTDFAGNGVELKDAYIGYTGFDNANITLGHHKMPFGLAELTSSKYTTMMERSVVSDLFVPSRQNGVSVATGGDTWSLTGAVHMQGIDNENDEKDEDYGYGLRAHIAPWVDGTDAIHLGAAYHHQEYEKDGLVNGGYGEQEFGVRPEIHMVDHKLYEGTLTGVEDKDTYGLEAAAVFGPVSLQAEYMTADIGTQSRDADFSGWYVMGSWFLTGESRNYVASEGVFDRVTPNTTVGQGGYGAWELAVRYSELDMDDHDAPWANANYFGQKGDITTIGLNWYPTRNIRFMANYVNATSEYSNTGRPDDDIKAFQLRGQIDF